MPKARSHLKTDEARSIARLSALEKLRDQARDGQRLAMLANIEKLIEAELRAIRHMRGEDSQRPEG